MNLLQLPTLFKKTATGAMQTWTISTDFNQIITRWGQVDGAIQQATETVLQGKNIGKKNETSPVQQAEFEAKSQHEKKLKKGYVTSREAAERGDVDSVIEGGVSPMLAHRFDEQGHKIKYHCFAQPKLDGHRCIAVVDSSGKCTLWSRTRKPITSMDHVITAIEALGIANVTFDGELYSHEYRDKFEQLTSMIRASERKPGVGDIVQYHIYDLVHPTWTFAERFSKLDDILEYASAVIEQVETELIEDAEELTLAFERFVVKGYEGAMVRNAGSKYVNKRSYDLQKVKEFKDSEYLVTGVEEGRGKLAGHAIFVCVTKEGYEFRAKLVGDQEALKPFFERPETAIGRMLTVKYQGITSGGVPRFPVALRFAEAL